MFTPEPFRAGLSVDPRSVGRMSTTPLFLKVDAVTIPVPDLDAGLRFYRDSLGHELLWLTMRPARWLWLRPAARQRSC